MEIRAAQEMAWHNKRDKGFNMNDVPLEFGLLTAEVGEAFTAWRKRLDDFGEELADIAIYLLAIAEMNGIDLDTEVRKKIEKNAARTYERTTDGTLTRVDEPECPGAPGQGCANGPGLPAGQYHSPAGTLGRTSQ